MKLLIFPFVPIVSCFVVGSVEKSLSPPSVQPPIRYLSILVRSPEHSPLQAVGCFCHETYCWLLVNFSIGICCVCCGVFLCGFGFFGFFFPSAKLLFNQSASILLYGVIPAGCRTLHFLMLNFMKYLPGHFSSLLRSLWMIPMVPNRNHPIYQALHTVLYPCWGCTLSDHLGY